MKPVLAGVAVLLAVVLVACGDEQAVDAAEFRDCAERDLGTYPRPENQFPSSEDAVSFGLSSKKLDGGRSSLLAGGPDAFVYDSTDAATDGADEATAAGLKVDGEENVLWVSSRQVLSGDFAATLRNCVREAS